MFEGEKMLSGTNNKEKNNLNSLCIKRHENKIGDFLMKFRDFRKKGSIFLTKKSAFSYNMSRSSGHIMLYEPLPVILSGGFTF